MQESWFCQAVAAATHEYNAMTVRSACHRYFCIRNARVAAADDERRSQRKVEQFITGAQFIYGSQSHSDQCRLGRGEHIHGKQASTLGYNGGILLARSPSKQWLLQCGRDGRKFQSSAQTGGLHTDVVVAPVMMSISSSSSLDIYCHQ
jgi:hypothetical protein